MKPLDNTSKNIKKISAIISLQTGFISSWQSLGHGIYDQ